MRDEQFAYWAERVVRELEQVNKQLAKILEEIKVSAVTYTIAGQPLTSSEAVNEELRRLQKLS